jgi:hypothetical protein
MVIITKLSIRVFAGPPWNSWNYGYANDTLSNLPIHHPTSYESAGALLIVGFALYLGSRALKKRLE